MKNTTLEKLSGLPFDSATELKNAQQEVQLSAWHRLEKARATSELIQREEFHFIRDEFAAGFSCVYGEEENKTLVRVYSNPPGITIEIDKKVHDDTLGILVKSVSEAFALTHYRVMGLLEDATIPPISNQTKD